MTAPDDASSVDAAAAEERSAAELLSDLASEAGVLMRQELALFKREVAQILARAGRGVMALVLGAVLLFGGGCALLAAATLALSLLLPPWLAALLVAAASCLAGAGLLYFGRRRLAVRALAPRRALGSLRADAAALRRRPR
jgi:hypothetical protein